MKLSPPQQELDVETFQRRLYQEQYKSVLCRTTEAFGGLFLFQFVAAVTIAFFVSPNIADTAPEFKALYLKVAILGGCALVAFPAYFAFYKPSSTAAPYAITVAQMLFSSLFIWLSHGRIEAHFHIFASLAILMCYRNVPVLIVAALIAVLDQLIRGSLWPIGIYGGFDSSPFRIFEHIFWIVLTCGILIRAARQHQREMFLSTKRQAKLEASRLQADSARELAEQSTMAKSVFLASMSHELRTPLNAIIGYSEMLQEDASLLSNEEFGADLEKINTAGRQLLLLINDILDLSKIEAGKMELHVESFEVESMLKDVAATVKPLAAKKSNQFEIKSSKMVGSMIGDQTKIRQSLLNLLSNACKFTEKGQITLEVMREIREHGDWIIFQVKDTGIGLAEEQQQRIFQEFTQAEARTSSKYGGTGLGLALTKKFCELMKGSVKVESALAEGSTFTIELPASIDKPVMVARGTDGTARLLQAGEKPLVLLVDDDIPSQDLMKRYLLSEGFEIEIAGTASEGFELAEAHLPSAIILDILLPDKDGWTLLSQLKSHRKLAMIPVIVMSSLDDKNQGFSLGASEYLPKPVSRAQLRSVLNKYKLSEHTAEALVIDDDDLTREMLRGLLERDGWSVKLADHGKIALDILQTTTPSIILLDLMMPEMDGFAFLEEIKKHEHLKKVPVVILTAMDISSEEEALLTGKVESILQKGAYRKEELLQILRQQIAEQSSSPQST